ncbi:hypothetical protein KY359_04890 [Candidatus Woesearchaeota archaeon]|nr:hypothetical protein [Candidatus Woesearchaeota archaeon]
MRFVLLVLVFLLVSGCASGSYVSFSNISQMEPAVAGTNRTVDKLSFVVQNDKDYEVVCDVIIEMSNGTSAESKRAAAGSFGPGERKNVSLTMSMFEGNTSLKIVPDCSAP